LDYVVAGFGIGAILALAGFALWELYGDADELGTGWLSRAAIGLMLGALVIWSVTGVTLLSTIDDSTGSRLVFFTSLVTLISVAAGTYWYWRADRAIAASIQRQPRPRADPAPVSADDVEPSEWDSWPERDANRREAPELAAAVIAENAGSFEPEVAAEAVEAPDEAAEPELDDQTAVAIAAVDEPAVAEEADAEANPAPEPAPEPAVGDTAVADDAPAEPIPANVLPLRLPATVESAPGQESDDREETVGAVDEAAPAEPESTKEPEAPEPKRRSNSGDGTPTTFESSLLADIDATSADGDGRYRSPLLADLVPDPNELEGVGLAKWRHEARLRAGDPEPQRKPRT
jgi:hypothetical protein